MLRDGIVLLLFLAIGVVAMLVELASWPCGKCAKRWRPWVKSCPECLGRMARRFEPPITIYVGGEWGSTSKAEQAQAIRRAIALGKRGSVHVKGPDDEPPKDAA